MSDDNIREVWRMRKILVHCFATALIALASAQPAMAQNDKMMPVAIPAQPSAIPHDRARRSGRDALAIARAHVSV